MTAGYGNDNIAQACRPGRLGWKLLDGAAVAVSAGHRVEIPAVLSSTLGTDRIRGLCLSEGGQNGGLSHGESSDDHARRVSAAGRRMLEARQRGEGTVRPSGPARNGGGVQQH